VEVAAGNIEKRQTPEPREQLRQPFSQPARRFERRTLTATRLGAAEKIVPIDNAEESLALARILTGQAFPKTL
jgi:hypothetical protein